MNNKNKGDESMKTKDKKKLFTTICTVFIFSLAVAVAIISGFALAPDIISYSVSTKESVPNTSGQTEKCLYSRFSEITDDGPFEIRCIGKNIYVLKNNSYLYRINAPLERFTAADVSIMREGITLQNRTKLSELVQNLES